VLLGRTIRSDGDRIHAAVVQGAMRVILTPQ
jgi:hypothetical protein